jgi:protein farnesyltransferase/geranylgeranyltransferase type-1 subunit alpha
LSWLVKEFGVWEEYLAFSEAQITFDFKNNSAWNFRYFVLTQSPEADPER